MLIANTTTNNLVWCQIPCQNWLFFLPKPGCQLPIYSKIYLIELLLQFEFQVQIRISTSLNLAVNLNNPRSEDPVGVVAWFGCQWPIQQSSCFKQNLMWKFPWCFCYGMRENQKLALNSYWRTRSMVEIKSFLTNFCIFYSNWLPDMQVRSYDNNDSYPRYTMFLRQSLDPILLQEWSKEKNIRVKISLYKGNNHEP